MFYNCLFLWQIEPLEREIKESKLRILDLEVSLESLLKKKSFRGKILMSCVQL